MIRHRDTAEPELVRRLSGETRPVLPRCMRRSIRICTVLRCIH